MKENISLIPYPFSLKKTEGFYNTKELTFNKLCKKIHFETKESYNNFSLENKESYVLQITPFSINIFYSYENGKFYALETLKQLFMSYKSELPCLEILDKPEYEWRGFLLDTVRSFYSVEFLKKIIDALSFHKFNVFHWHLTDDQGWRINIPEYPNLIKIGSERKAHTMPESKEGDYEPPFLEKKYYSDQEIQEIVEYAKKRFIKVVPEIELPGHVSSLLAAYPEFGCTGGPYNVENRWGIFPDVLCLGNDNIFKIYDAIFATIERLFPDKYVHIGGDECLSERWKECPKCQKRMKDNKLSNPSELQSWATKKMVDLLIKHNKIPIGWDEVLDNTERINLPESVIVQSWRGFEGGERAANLNHKVIMSPQTHCYLNLKNYENYEEPGRLGFITCEKAYSYSPVTSKMNTKQSSFILGGECNLWTEALPYSKVAEYLLFPRLCAISECLWLNRKNKNFNRFKNNLDLHKKRLHELDFIYYDGKLE